MCEKHVFFAVRADFGTEQEKPEPCVGFNTTKGKTCFFFFLFSGPIRVGLSKQIKQKEFRDEAGYKYHKKEEHVLLAGE